MIQVDNDIFRVVADHDKEASLLFLHAIANERLDARIPGHRVREGDGIDMSVFRIRTIACAPACAPSLLFSPVARLWVKQTQTFFSQPSPAVGGTQMIKIPKFWTAVSVLPKAVRSGLAAGGA
jgi:hypothetical protein